MLKLVAGIAAYKQRALLTVITEKSSDGDCRGPY